MKTLRSIILGIAAFIRGGAVIFGVAIVAVIFGMITIQIIENTEIQRLAFSAFIVFLIYVVVGILIEGRKGLPWNKFSITTVLMEKGEEKLRIGYGNHGGRAFFRIDLWRIGWRIIKSGTDHE